ncbi:MAG TPA: hypothetical protein VN805_10435 [Caulobacteraceae bacterium]|nr:hypothetical protein [Caulobacteraceae bacterium]
MKTPVTLMIALALALGLAGAANAKHCPYGHRHGGSCLHRALRIVHHRRGYT